MILTLINKQKPSKPNLEKTMLKRMILSGLAVAVLVGCGGPPKEEIEKAKAAKAAADKVNAVVYAAEVYNAAATLD